MALDQILAMSNTKVICWTRSIWYTRVHGWLRFMCPTAFARFPACRCLLAGAGNFRLRRVMLKGWSVEHVHSIRRARRLNNRGSDNMLRQDEKLERLPFIRPFAEHLVDGQVYLYLEECRR